MKKQMLIIVMVFFIASTITMPIGAAVERVFNYQGVLKNASNVPITTATTIQFSLYNSITLGAPIDSASSSGPLLWKETYDGVACAQIVPNAQGVISVKLGDCVAFPSYLDFSATYYLGLTIGTNSEATPRLMLTSVPYAENVRNITFDNNQPNAFRIGTSMSDYLMFNSATGNEMITLGQNTTIGSAVNQLTIGAILQGASPLTFEGATVDGNRTVLSISDPTGNRIITLPDNSGTVALLSDLPSAITASNGLSRVLNDIQFGGVLTQNTLIDGNGGAYDLTFQDLKNFDIGGGGVGALGSISNTSVDVIATDLLQLISPMTYVQSGTPNVSGLRLVNLNSASPTNTGQAIGVDALGNIVTVAAGGSINDWSLTGNSGTDGGVTNFLGTIDAQDLVFRTNNIEMARFYQNTGASANSVALGGGVAINSNMFVFGQNAGQNATNANNSNFFGLSAGRNATFAYSSNFFGSSAGQNATFAYSSNFFGPNAGLNATNANDSNFFGLSAGQSATNANNTNFFGPNAGNGATFANYSNFFGQSAGQSATNANNSNFFGTNAGFNATFAYSSNFFGESAGVGAIFANNSNFFGLSAGDGATNASNSNFSGLNAGVNATNANDSNFFGQNAGDGATDAAGSNFFGLSAGYRATNANYSNFFGFGAGNDATNAQTSNFFGLNAGLNATDAAGSNFFGPHAGVGATYAAGSNFFGLSAGNDATLANNSNFFGTSAGQSATNANSSNFYGTNAGINAANANDSNFIGSSAGQDAFNANNSNFIGNLAGFSAINAYNSNFFGVGAGQGAINAYDSSFYGTNAGNSATDANNSNFIGSNAGLNATNASRSNFFGMGAGDGAAGAFSSNFFGPNTGQNATNANSSNFFGELAGMNAANANNSNFFGYQSGERALNAANSIFIGNGAGNNDSVDNFNVPGTSILIGDNTSTGGNSNSIAIGFKASNDRANQFLVGSTYSDFSFRNVNYTFPSAQATGAGEVLTNDGTGILSWAVAGIGSVTASNGLNAVGIDVRLGGALTQPTTITATGGDNLTINGSAYTNNLGLFSVSRNAGSAAAGSAIQGNSIVNAGVPLMQNAGGRFDAVSGDTGVATVNYGTLNTASVSGTAPGIVNVGSRNVASFNISGGNLASLRGTENLANLGAGSVGSAFGSLNDVLLQNGTNITNAFGVTTSLTKGATASVSRFSGFYMEDNNTGIANRSGLFLGTTANINYTGEWGIYSALDRNNAINGFLSVGSLTAPTTRLQVTTGVANDSGLRLTNLTSASPSVPGQAIGVDANGKVVTVGGSTLDAVYRSNPGTSNIVNIDSATGAPTFRISNTDNTGILFENSVTPSRSMYIGQDNVFTTSNVIEGNGMNMRIGTGSNHDLLFRTNGSERMRVLSGGNVAIGTNSAANKLTVEDLATTSVARFNGSGGTQCTVVSGTGITCSSDQRLKKDIISLSSGTEIMNALRPVTYNWLSGGAIQYGFIAQEVQEVIPGLILTGSDGMLSLNTTGLIPFIVKSQQELNERLLVLEKSAGAAVNTVYIDGTTNTTNDLVNSFATELATLTARLDSAEKEIETFKSTMVTKEMLADAIASALAPVTDVNVSDPVPIQSSDNDTTNPIDTVDTTGIQEPVTAASRLDASYLQNQSGIAVIRAGEFKKTIAFTKEFANDPVVNLTPVGLTMLNNSINYAITQSDKKGFTIQISRPIDGDIEFNWIAVKNNFNYNRNYEDTN